MDHELFRRIWGEGGALGRYARKLIISADFFAVIFQEETRERTNSAFCVQF